VSGVEEVIYRAPGSISASTTVPVGYRISDQHADATASGKASVQLDAGPTLTPVAGSSVQSGQSTEIAMVTPGLSGDTLTLSPSKNQTVSLKLVNGVYEVIFTAPGNFNSSPIETVTYSVTDQHNDVVAFGKALVGGDTNQAVKVNGDTTVILGNGNDSVALGGTSNAVSLGDGKDTVTVSGGGNTISLGSGNDSVALNGTSNAVLLGNGNDIVTVSVGGNTISLGSGNDRVQGGTGDTIQLAGAGNLTVSGKSEMVFLGGGNDIVTDRGQGLELNIGPTAGTDSLANFASDLKSGVIDLLGGIGGYTSASQAYAALQSDGHGGALLPLGNGESLDILGVSPGHLRANNFHIG
jgi:hypothetical protein